MEKRKLFMQGIVLGVLVLLFGAGVTISNASGRHIPDPNQSLVQLTGPGTLGLTTCPAGDGAIYQYLKVTVKDALGNPMSQLSPSLFSFSVTSAGASYHGTLSCTFTAVDAETNANGEIRFTIRGDTSITGNISIHVTVIGVTLNTVTLTCKTMDYNLDGVVSLGDFTVFGSDFSGTHWRSDFNWDGSVSLADFTVFGQHFTHS